jgi:hypothetical protein
MALKKEDAKFRGMWSPRVGSPGGYAFKFLPTAPAQKPKSKHAPPPDPVIGRSKEKSIYFNVLNMVYNAFA